MQLIQSFIDKKKWLLVLIDVLKKGVYIGGGILPGIDMSINTLYGNTVKLPRVKFTTPSSVLGTDTMKKYKLQYSLVMQDKWTTHD